MGHWIRAALAPADLQRFTWSSGFATGAAAADTGRNVPQAQRNSGARLSVEHPPSEKKEQRICDEDRSRKKPAIGIERLAMMETRRATHCTPHA